jgi:hypothetical protein
MHINAIRKIAKKMNIDPRSMDKKELIRSIQIKEGNFPCFKTDPSFCDEYDCCWRTDCQPGALIGIS